MKKYKVSIIGLGYVGLPLLIEFNKKYKTVGFDIDDSRVQELLSGFDRTNEALKKDLKKLSLSSDPEVLSDSDFFIVTVPTPVTEANIPNLHPLESASKLVGKYLKKGSIVVYESTVFPGCTEEFCIPILEKISGLKLNQDFFCGYSPERINPGDKQRTITKILKITSGSSSYAAKKIDKIYSSIIEAGTFKARNIKVAEAAKVIENTQRDINIALMNELSLIFDRLDINTHDVLEAASTKWNFINFVPGLVGGHCIGVDPYYLTFKAEQAGYHPEVILAGRRINDTMPAHIASKIIKKIVNKKAKLNNLRALILGATFKENCPDTRNSKVFDLVDELSEYAIDIDWYDPLVNTPIEHKIKLKNQLSNRKYDLIILAVSHKEFRYFDNPKVIHNFSKPNALIFDLKNFFKKIQTINL